MLSPLFRTLARIAAIVRRRHEDRDLDEEIDAHLALLADEHRRRGLSELEARRAARLVFGGPAQLREAHREVRGLPLLDECLQDLRYAVRGCRREPGFAALAILTLAVGIGANAAVFSVVHGILVQPLPYRDADALLSLTRNDGRSAARWISLRRWEVMREARTFEAAVYRPVVEDAILAGDDPIVLRAGAISANLLGVLGVQPILGRTFRAEDDAPGSAPVTLIGERLWSTRFGKDPAIVGRTISLGSTAYTVVGILPARFQFVLRDVDIWLPKPSAAAFVAPQYHACCVPLMGVARMRAGVTREQADAELSVLNARYETGVRVDAGPARFTLLKADLVAGVDSMLWLLFAAVGLVLLIACANVATLLLTRATTRAREFALRSALGARRTRVLRQLVTESLVLSLIASLIGLVIARAAVAAVSQMRLLDLPRASEIEVDTTVLLWTIGVAVATGLVFGTFPSLQLIRPGVMDRLRQGGATEPATSRPGRLRLSTRGVMVASQVALSLILLVAAALMAQTITRLTSVDLGFRSTGLLTMRVPLPVKTYDTPEKRSRFFDELVRRVNLIPGVDGATLVRALPTTGGLGTNMQIVSAPIAEPGHVGLMLQSVVPGYFEVLGLALKQGRVFESRDNIPGGAPVAVVNESFAKRFWPSYPKGSTPVGDRLLVPVVSTTPFDIVGVVADVRHSGPARDANPQVYIPDWMYPPQTAFLALRAAGDPLHAIDAVRAQVRFLDVNQSVTDEMMMDDLLERAVGQQHLAARVLGGFAATALLLAVIGLYGAMAYSVAQRTQEIGVRRALGADSGRVLWMIVWQGLRVTIIGIVCGLAGAYASTRLLESLLFEVKATDVFTFVFVPAIFVVVALLASVMPAWRAVRINPVETLRI